MGPRCPQISTRRRARQITLSTSRENIHLKRNSPHHLMPSQGQGGTLVHHYIRGSVCLSLSHSCDEIQFKNRSSHHVMNFNSITVGLKTEG